MSLSEKMFGSQRAITIWVVSIVFAIVFPAYFSYMASSSDAMGGAAAGARGPAACAGAADGRRGV